jgi:hypothetical protein
MRLRSVSTRQRAQWRLWQKERDEPNVRGRNATADTLSAAGDGVRCVRTSKTLMFMNGSYRHGMGKPSRVLGELILERMKIKRREGGQLALTELLAAFKS